MRDRQITTHHVFALLLVFWLAWLYTEVTEYFSRDAFTEEVVDFMHRGDRFTSDDGARLEKKIAELEKQLEEG